MARSGTTTTLPVPDTAIVCSGGVSPSAAATVLGARAPASRGPASRIASRVPTMPSAAYVGPAGRERVVEERVMWSLT